MMHFHDIWRDCPEFVLASCSLGNGQNLAVEYYSAGHATSPNGSNAAQVIVSEVEAPKNTSLAGIAPLRTTYPAVITRLLGIVQVIPSFPRPTERRSSVRPGPDVGVRSVFNLCYTVVDGNCSWEYNAS